MSLTRPMPSQRGHMPPVMLNSRRSFTFWPPRSRVTAPAPLIEATLKENAWGEPTCGCPSRLNRIRSIAFASVTVPTVERGLAPIRSWSTRIAVVSPSSTSTSGRASVGMKPCTNALYVSLIIRCDSAAIVPKTSELLTEPETPVNTVSRRFGISTLRSLRLFTRAPCTRITSWLSAACGPEAAPAFAAGLMVWSGLRDPDHVPRRVPERAVARTPRLRHRLLEHLGPRGAQLLEGRVEVVGPEDGHLQRALGDQREQGVALDLREAAVRLEQDDVEVLPQGADGDPAEAVGRDVVAHLEAQRVTVEAEGLVGVVDRDEHGRDGDCHGPPLRPPVRRALLRSCSVPQPRASSPCRSPVPQPRAAVRPARSCGAVGSRSCSRRTARSRGPRGRGRGSARASGRRSR